ncbi:MULTISPECIES: class I SAM-dependent methyltransferase [Chitinophagaceae]
MDLPGIAIKEYYFDKSKSRLWVHDEFGPAVEMPVAVYFRQEKDFPQLEKVALQHCEGKILDIGAGAGAHSLYLQEKGKDITALEISPTACEVMAAQGVSNIICGDFFRIELPQYDTLLLLMNGIGICGTIATIPYFLQKAKSILNDGGSVIFDSSDIQYMYEDIAMPSHYYGEMTYQYRYKKLKTERFNWLYIDKTTMRSIVEQCGWKMVILFEDKNDQYLAELTIDHK